MHRTAAFSAGRLQISLRHVSSHLSMNAGSKQVHSAAKSPRGRAENSPGRSNQIGRSKQPSLAVAAGRGQPESLPERVSSSPRPDSDGSTEQAARGGTSGGRKTSLPRLPDGRALSALRKGDAAVLPVEQARDLLAQLPPAQPGKQLPAWRRYLQDRAAQPAETAAAAGAPAAIAAGRRRAAQRDRGGGSSTDPQASSQAAAADPGQAATAAGQTAGSPAAASRRAASASNDADQAGPLKQPEFPAVTDLPPEGIEAAPILSRQVPFKLFPGLGVYDRAKDGDWEGPGPAGAADNASEQADHEAGDTSAERSRPPRRVILTNDDGPSSPFFELWVEHVQGELGWDCVVCAPASGQSFVSKSMTRTPIQVDAIEDGSEHYIEASPASCVNLGVYTLAPDADLVISGPNVGHNAGRGSILSSGTVGAAMEGAIAGRRAIAISFPFFNGWNNWTTDEVNTAIRVAGLVTARLWFDWDGTADLYNVNIPVSINEDEHEVVLTTVDSSAQYESLYALNEESGQYEWAPKGLRVFQMDWPQPGGDVAAVKGGNVSVTPLMAGFRAPPASGGGTDSDDDGPPAADKPRRRGSGDTAVGEANSSWAAKATAMLTAPFRAAGAMIAGALGKVLMAALVAGGTAALRPLLESDESEPPGPGADEMDDDA